MTSFPSAFEERMKIMLKEEAEAFFQALQTEPPVSIRINLAKLSSGQISNIIPDVSRQVDWCEEGYNLNNRPIFTLDPCYHGGAYYVQEASSMFLKQVLQQILPAKAMRVLDLCAAPGGKSTLLASALSTDSLLVANEVIRSRASVLKENVIKWGHDKIIVTNNDPADFTSLDGLFDIILVDAPCSGEGMFRKDPQAIEEWNEGNLQLCSARQKRILSDVWPALKEGGFLIYSTCTYNPGENEEILEWMLNKYSCKSIKIEHTFNSITLANSTAYGYRFYPHKTLGEGFFIGCIQKTEATPAYRSRNKKTQRKETSVLPETIRTFISKPEAFYGYTNEQTLGFLPCFHRETIEILEKELRILYKGCECAEIIGKKIRYLHPLALYHGLRTENCTLYEADRNTALTYLKKEDIPPFGSNATWILVSYKGIPIGWCKNLGNRLNNYYPKEWRIRMEIK